MNKDNTLLCQWRQRYKSNYLHQATVHTSSLLATGGGGAEYSDILSVAAFWKRGGRPCLRYWRCGLAPIDSSCCDLLSMPWNDMEMLTWLTHLPLGRCGFESKYIISKVIWVVDNMFPQTQVSNGVSLARVLEQGKSEGFDRCDRPSNLTQIGFKTSIFQPVWP